MLSSCSVRRLLVGGVYSRCGVYSRKYDIHDDEHDIALPPINTCMCSNKRTSAEKALFLDQILHNRMLLESGKDWE